MVILLSTLTSFIYLSKNWNPKLNQLSLVSLDLLVVQDEGLTYIHPQKIHLDVRNEDLQTTAIITCSSSQPFQQQLIPQSACSCKKYNGSGKGSKQKKIKQDMTEKCFRMRAHRRVLHFGQQYGVHPQNLTALQALEQ